MYVTVQENGDVLAIDQERGQEPRSADIAKTAELVSYDLAGNAAKKTSLFSFSDLAEKPPLFKSYPKITIT